MGYGDYDEEKGRWWHPDLDAEDGRYAFRRLLKPGVLRGEMRQEIEMPRRGRPRNRPMDSLDIERAFEIVREMGGHEMGAQAVLSGVCALAKLGMEEDDLVALLSRAIQEGLDEAAADGTAPSYHAYFDIAGNDDED